MQLRVCYLYIQELDIEHARIPFVHLSGDKTINRAMSDDLNLFIKFTVMVESHFKDNCILARIMRGLSSVPRRPSGASKNENIDHFTDSINGFLLSLRDSMSSYDSLDVFRKGKLKNDLIASDENIFNICAMLLQ